MAEQMRETALRLIAEARAQRERDRKRIQELEEKLAMANVRLGGLRDVISKFHHEVSAGSEDLVAFVNANRETTQAKFGNVKEGIARTAKETHAELDGILQEMTELEALSNAAPLESGGPEGSSNERVPADFQAFQHDRK